MPNYKSAQKQRHKKIRKGILFQVVNPNYYMASGWWMEVITEFVHHFWISLSGFIYQFQRRKAPTILSKMKLPLLGIVLIKVSFPDMWNGNVIVNRTPMVFKERKLKIHTSFTTRNIFKHYNSGCSEHLVTANRFIRSKYQISKENIIPSVRLIRILVLINNWHRQKVKK